METLITLIPVIIHHEGTEGMARQSRNQNSKHYILNPKQIQMRKNVMTKTSKKNKKFSDCSFVVGTAHPTG